MMTMMMMTTTMMTRTLGPRASVPRVRRNAPALCLAVSVHGVVTVLFHVTVRWVHAAFPWHVFSFVPCNVRMGVCSMPGRKDMVLLGVGLPGAAGFPLCALGAMQGGCAKVVHAACLTR